MAFIRKLLLQCRSFPRTVREDTAFAAANSKLIDSPPLAYTSLKDLLPRRPPLRGLSMQSVHEIPITNVLVQRAAWAYLQPTPVQGMAASSSSNGCILSRVWEELRPPVNACIRFFNRKVMTAITQALNRLFAVINVGGGQHDHHQYDMY